MERIESLEQERRDIRAGFRVAYAFSENRRPLMDEQNQFFERLRRPPTASSAGLTDQQAIDLVRSMRTHKGTNRRMS